MLSMYKANKGVVVVVKFELFFFVEKFRVLGIKNDHPFMLVKFKI